MDEKTVVAPELPNAKTQARAFETVRAAHQTETAEDYVELIADLIAAQGEARLVDLAKRLGVSHPTASKVIERLQREELVVSRPYRSIFLTEKGEALARRCKARHQIVSKFLQSLGISEPIAEIDAEGVEHHVSEETIAAFHRALVAKGIDVPDLD
ncbi:MAG: manganese-binding transcriptional regulator MntR [Pseudomonadota bacterium]